MQRLLTPQALSKYIYFSPPLIFSTTSTELGQKNAQCESLRVVLHYVEWDRIVAIAGSKNGLRATLSYLLHFMNMYTKKCRPISLIYVGCINWYFRNKTLFLRLRSPYFHFTYTGVYYTGTCFIKKIYAPSPSLLQGKHLPFTPSPLRLNIFRLFVILSLTQLYRYTPEISLFSTATFKYTYRDPLRQIGQDYSAKVACRKLKSLKRIQPLPVCTGFFICIRNSLDRPCVTMPSWSSPLKCKVI